MVGMQSWIPPPTATKASSTWRSRPAHDVGDMDLIEMLQYECDLDDHEQIEAIAVQAWRNTSTKYDARDMYRMGKAQEFRVRQNGLIFMFKLTQCIAQLPSTLSFKLCSRTHCYLGVSHDIMYSRTR
jgi:hypothetical protein